MPRSIGHGAHGAYAEVPRMTIFSNALVRKPGANFVDGITTAALGVPILEIALEQHARYAATLVRCGVRVTTLEPEPAFPDSTFVEDTAVLAGGRATLTRPGAATRRGEVDAIRPALSRFFSEFGVIEEPGTLDGGDVCEAGDRVYIGISRRTNAAGAQQLAASLASAGRTTTFVDIRSMTSLLHLKSGMAYVGEGTFVVIDALRPLLDLRDDRVIEVHAGDEYGANCIRVNDVVLIAAGYGDLERELVRRGFAPVVLDMSEFAKMDGGLSCLSLRF
jgi:dimethylargininase